MTHQGLDRDCIHGFTVTSISLSLINGKVHKSTELVFCYILRDMFTCIYELKLIWDDICRDIDEFTMRSIRKLDAHQGHTDG